MTKEELKRLIELEQRSKSNTKRINEHDVQIKELSNVYIALTKVTDKVDNVEKDVTEMKNDIKDIKDKPSKKLDQIWGYIVSAIIGGLIGFIFLRLGLK